MRLQLNLEMRRIRRPLAKQLTTCENTSSLFVLDLAGSANAPMNSSENSGRVFNMRKGIFPVKTSKNWMVSSSEAFLRTRPTRVLRGSRAILKTGPSFSLRACNSGSLSSASTHIVRNLCMVKVLPSFPTRSCLNSTGPFGSSILITMAIMANSQQKQISTAALKTMSKARLIAQ